MHLAILKEEKLRLRAIQLKKSSGISDLKLSKRLKKSVYWIRKTLAKKIRNNRAGLKNQGARKKFAKINERVAHIIN